MFDFYFDILLRGFVLALLLYLSSKFTAALGGMIYAIFTQTFRIPYLGPVFVFLINGKVKLGIVLKFIGWLISSSGLLLGIWIYYIIWGVPIELWEFWILLIAAVVNIVNIIYDIIYYQGPTFKEHFEFFTQTKWSAKLIGEENHAHLVSDPSIQKILSRSLFVDMHLPQLFQLLAAIGVLYFAMGSLNFVGVIDSAPNLVDSLRLSFSMFPFVKTDIEPFTGLAWQVCNTIASFIIFIWSVFFIASARTRFLDEKEIGEGEPSKLDKQMMEIFVKTAGVELHLKDLHSKVEEQNQDMSRLQRTISRLKWSGLKR